MQTINRTCRVTGREFTLSPQAQELCRRLEVPLPTIHPIERLRKLCAFSNYINLFRGTCALTGEKTLSIYRPNAPFPVYATPVWWSEAWSPLSYGRSYDFSKLFFDQFYQLMTVVPQAALSVTYTTLENCDYINGASYCKQCYLLCHGAHCEDCYYCFGGWRSRDCIDCNSIKDSELCYDGCELLNCYQVRHSFNCRNCRDSAFLWNCIGVSDCFGCVNQRSGRFKWFDEQLSEADFRRRWSEIRWDDYGEIEGLRSRFHQLVRQAIQPAIRGIQFENSTGDFINNCSDCERCYQSLELRDCVNCMRLEDSHDCMDVYAFGLKCEQLYCVTRSGFNSTNIKFSTLGYLNASDLEYCMWCPGCKDCFGCIGLQKQQYCILNKQYSKSEYFELKRRIVAQMSDPAFTPPDCRYGEYFPYSCAPYPYNDSDAQLLFPLAREEALARGAQWADDEIAPPAHGKFNPYILRTSDVAGTEIAGEFECLSSKRPFRITKPELKIYRERSYPLPREDWKSRLLRREALKNGYELYPHKCELSGREISSTFPPGQGWRVVENSEFTRAGS